jgi:hypothetical protein
VRLGALTAYFTALAAFILHSGERRIAKMKKTIAKLNDLAASMKRPTATKNSILSLIKRNCDQKPFWVDRRAKFEKHAVARNTYIEILCYRCVQFINHIFAIYKVDKIRFYLGACCFYSKSKGRNRF